MESSLLVKTFLLIEATAGAHDGRPLAELAAEVGVPKSTAHRILKSLVAMGYVESCGPGIYRQTPRLLRLAMGADDRRLLRHAEPLLRELHRETEETVNLGVLRLNRIRYLLVLESPQPLRRIVGPEMTDPFATTALGRAIVAHLPPERQSFLLRHTALEKRTPHTIVDTKKLGAILEVARREGFALEQDETDLGVTCLGAPVFDADGVTAAISVSVPTARAGEPRRDRLIKSVRRTAKALSDLLVADRGEDVKPTAVVKNA
jgi:DNA-binding IclR family transcriptional regulator